MTHLVFVYGTLRNGYGNHRLIAHAQARGGAHFVGFGMTAMPATLVNVGWFPAITTLDEGPCPVVGEVYRVDDEALRDLDRLEGVPSLYTREATSVIVEPRRDGDERINLDALTYVWARTDGEDLTVIPSGDFTDCRTPDAFDLRRLRQ